MSRASQIAAHLSPPSSSLPNYAGSKDKLNTGASIPLLGFGTWQDVEEQEPAVLAALKAGYRHIDTARIYGTEKAVGEAIRKSGVPREEVFVTTKLWNHQHHPEDVEGAVDDSLRDLGMGYVDLFLMHWPVAWKRGVGPFPFEGRTAIVDNSITYLDTWKALEKVYRSGKVRAIGVSNFNRAEIENILKNCDVPPAAHQLELHPYLQQTEFVEWNQEKRIHVIGYSPFGNSNPAYPKGKSVPQLIQNPVLVDIGKKYDKSGAQVALAWGVSRNMSVIPKSKTESRIKQNFEGDFKLSDEEMKAIDSLDKNLRFSDPSKMFGWDFYVGLDGK